MPLEFESVSHGTIAFGFFNIATDMILLNHYFLFAEDFCHSLSIIAESPSPETLKTTWDICMIEQREKIGNLMGAIYGTDHRGFIGEVYQRFPFPKKKEEFKQKPDGFKRRSEIEEIIQKYSKRVALTIGIDPNKDQVAIGEYVFRRSSFQELVRYVWLGGYPRWQDGIRPDYVLVMMEKIEQSGNFLFEELRLAP